MFILLDGSLNLEAHLFPDLVSHAEITFHHTNQVKKQLTAAEANALQSRQCDCTRIGLPAFSSAAVRD